MKNFLAWWVFFQLLIAGLASIEINNEMVDGTLVCPKPSHDSISMIMIPLVYFLPTHPDVERYCIQQWQQQEKPLAARND